MTKFKILASTLAFQLATVTPLIAQDLDMGARQAVALFSGACVANAGNGNAQRAWMEERQVPHLNSAGAAIFLKGQSGIGYDATNPTGRYALAVLDNGVCTVFAERAKGNDVISGIEMAFPELMRLKDHVDATNSNLHHYDYVLVHGGTEYNLIVSIADQADIQAALSIVRRVSDTPASL